VSDGSVFFGSHVVDKLHEEGQNVRVFDKVKPLREGVEWFKGDLLNEKDFLEGCKYVEALLRRMLNLTRLLRALQQNE